MQVSFLLILASCTLGNAFLYEFLLQFPKHALWAAYKVKYGKKYSSSEENSCIDAFWKNALEIRAHNKLYAQGLVSWKKDLNPFCDRDPAEFIQKNTGLIVEEVAPNLEAGKNVTKVEEEEKEPLLKSSNVAIPAEYNGCKAIPNWYVRDQKNCGTCWSFSALGSIEAAYYKKNSVLLNLSEQYLTDCVYDRDGCNGGWMPKAYDYIKNVANGIVDETSYPYTYRYTYTEEKCKANDKTRVAKLGPQVSYFTVASDDNSIKRKVMEVGPLAVAVDCSDWVKYKSGIYSSDTRTFAANHAVLICGWGTFRNTPYWILRNSWGPDWGLEGYIWVNAQRSTKDAKITKGGLFTQYVFYPSLA
ncbi:uncharacterized protein LOC134833403 [Culicoides brevitarsis]|uniref:uncharacterized protein LOC134833403 n=1 Tax=Culicoides brevitarsis TaxID=469753 RepID=UPI00307BA834